MLAFILLIFISFSSHVLYIFKFSCPHLKYANAPFKAVVLL